jgi:hypothetical protein
VKSSSMYSQPHKSPASLPMRREVSSSQRHMVAVDTRSLHLCNLAHENSVTARFLLVTASQIAGNRIQDDYLFNDQPISVKLADHNIDTVASSHRSVRI